MLVKIVLAIIITEASRLAAKVTAARNGEPEIKEYWSRLQLHTLVLLSLTLNLVLIALGYVIKNRRGKTWVAFLTRIGYFFGELVATTALTTLLKSQLTGKHFNGLQAFWAPFLLLHLGSTETIAANLLDEKKLWRIYTLGLIIQFGMACYIVGRFKWGTDHALAYIAIPIFTAGFLKCAERLWILMFSGFSQFKNSALSTPSKPKGSPRQPRRASLDTHLTGKSIVREARHLHKAYLSFHMFVLLFADIRLIIYKKLSYIFRLESMLSEEEAFIHQNVKAEEAEEAFKRVDTELDFLFDVFYTKTIILDIPLGFAIRFIYFLLSTAALLAFSYAYTHKLEHTQVEICITYMLLFGAFFSDVIALVSHLFSNWTLYWLTDPRHLQHLPECFRRAIARILDLKRSTKGVKYMAQYSLLNDCLNANATKFNAAMKEIVDGKRILKKFWSIQPNAWVDVSPTWAAVDADLKVLIIRRLQEKREKYERKNFNFSYLSRLVEKEASEVVKGYGIVVGDQTNRIYDKIKWSINKVEFTHSLLLWHIATDILFHYHESPGSDRRSNQQISRKLSNYMMHLLVRRSFMLHSGISKLRYSDTCFEARYFIGWEMNIKGKNLAKAAKPLLDAGTEQGATPSDIRVEGEGGESVCEGGKSVFFAGRKLAKQLQSFLDEGWDSEELWEMICYFWMEMLFSAAYDCDWKEHAHQLGHGGELLSHVALLMAHLGLSKHLKMITDPDQGCEPTWDWDNVSQMASYLA